MGQPSKEEVIIVGDSLTSDMTRGHHFSIDTCRYNPDMISMRPFQNEVAVDEVPADSVDGCKNAIGSC